MDLMKFIGKIVHGAGRGKTLHAPTLNVAAVPDLAFGVYAVRASIEQKKYSAVMHWGPRPTFREDQPMVEVHLLDFEGDLYGETVEVEVGPFLREVRVFASPDELQAQIQEDIRRAREW